MIPKGLIESMEAHEDILEPIFQRKIGIRRWKLSFYHLNALIPLIFSIIMPGMLRLYAVLVTSVFLCVYAFSFRGSNLKRSVFIVLQFALVLLMVGWFSIGFAWMIFFPSASIGLLPTRRMVNRFAMVLVATNLFGGLLAVVILHQPAISWSMFLAALFAGLASVYGVRFQRQLAASRASLQRANETIEHLTMMAERERISRDLHDVMGHELSMITLKSQLAERLIDRDPEEAKREIRDIQNAARDALSQVREYIANIRRPRLASDIERAAGMLESAGIACQVVGLDPIRAMESAKPVAEQSGEANQVMTTVSLCIREAVTNIVKHSQATTAQMRLHLTDGCLHVALSDNGIGFNKDSLIRKARIGGFGLPGMVQRLVDLGGSFRLWSNGELLLSADALTRPNSHVPDGGSEKGLERGTLVSLMVPCRQNSAPESSEVSLS